MENINPLISIITAVKNGEKHLEECFESLQNQSYKNFEHIVIDGGSTDRTLEIINKVFVIILYIIQLLLFFFGLQLLLLFEHLLLL